MGWDSTGDFRMEKSDNQKRIPFGTILLCTSLVALCALSYVHANSNSGDVVQISSSPAPPAPRDDRANEVGRETVCSHTCASCPSPAIHGGQSAGGSETSPMPAQASSRRSHTAKIIMIFLVLAVCTAGSVFAYAYYNGPISSVVKSVVSWYSFIHTAIYNYVYATSYLAPLIRVVTLFIGIVSAVLYFLLSHKHPWAEWKYSWLAKALVVLLDFVFLAFDMFFEDLGSVILGLGVSLTIELVLMPAMGSSFGWKLDRQVTGGVWLRKATVYEDGTYRLEHETGYYVFFCMCFLVISFLNIFV